MPQTSSGTATQKNIQKQGKVPVVPERPDAMEREDQADSGPDRDNVMTQESDDEAERSH